MKSFLHYDIKVLMALLQALKGDKKFFKFLATNGYPELAAWSNVVRGDEEALHWLFNNGFQSIAIITIAVDGHADAQKWINDTTDDFLIYFTAACKKDMDGIRWLQKKNLEIFVLIAKEVQTIQELQQKEQVFPYRKR